MLADDIALTMQPRMGVKAIVHLLECFGSAEAIFGAGLDELTGKAELRPDIAKELLKKRYHADAEKELEFCCRNSIVPVASTSEHYPALLRECPDFPHVLYVRGEPRALSRRMLAVVGTRRATPYGTKMCERLIDRMAELYPDTVIVSGLAYGVDASAHRAALSCNLVTVGVNANPVTRIYPARHEPMVENILAEGGAVVSEYHSQITTNGMAFIPRNRLIAGMSQGTVVVESGLTGGSMVTAGMAGGYHRSVMAVPGRVGDPFSEGANSLIRTQKAVMVCSAEDIAREMMWDTEKPADRRKKETETYTNLSSEAADLLNHIGEGEAVSIDELSVTSGYSLPVLSSLLLELEMEGIIRMLPGKLIDIK